MGKYKTIESKIILTIWLLCIVTYVLALLNNFILQISNYLGLLGLIVVTIISYYKTELTTKSLFILLILGLFNIFSFIYFIDFAFVFRFLSIVSPGIQGYSLILLIILLYNKREKLSNIYDKKFGQTSEEIDKEKLNSKNNFKQKFSQLTNEEIEKKLQQDLLPEAILALNELKEERIKGDV